MEFRASRLADYDDDGIIVELQRVATLAPPGNRMTQEFLRRHGSVSPDTVRRHFGTWRTAMLAAGLGSHLDATGASKAEVIAELQRVATLLHPEPMSSVQFSQHGTMSSSFIVRMFGSWNSALAAAELPMNHRRYSEQEYRDNLLTAWEAIGRQPTYSEMESEHSGISPAAYANRWGTWSNAVGILLASAAPAELERLGITNLRRLQCYDESSLIAELQRVASLVPGSTMTRAQFSALSSIHPSTVVKRFESWSAALEAAGLADRYSGKRISEKMRNQAAKGLTDDELIQMLRDTAASEGVEVLTQKVFDAAAPISASAMRRRFGSWPDALRAAGLRSPRCRYPDADLYENLLAVWIHLGRQPTYQEMREPPSSIPAHFYEVRWGRWSAALAAFIEVASGDSPYPKTPSPSTGEGDRPPRIPKRPAGRVREDCRKIPLGLRWDVLQRDGFKCAVCGASPSREPECTLHVDHVIPFSRGGKTTEGNLRTLCAACNIGKSNKLPIQQ